MKILKDSPFYRDLVMDLEQARAEARVEGREEGRDAALQMLRAFLVFRYKIDAHYFDLYLQKADLAMLKTLANAVADHATLEGFEQFLIKTVTQEAEKTK